MRSSATIRAPEGDFCVKRLWVEARAGARTKTAKTTQLSTEERRQRDLFHGRRWRLCSCRRTASGAYRTRPEAWLCSGNECIRENYEWPTRIREPFVQSKRRHA